MQVREKVAAATFARGYLTGLVGNVFDSLFEQGYFYDPVEKEVAELFMPTLQQQVLPAPDWVMLRARWVTLRARWVTRRAR
jgi:hypothetical protein